MHSVFPNIDDFGGGEQGALPCPAISRPCLTRCASARTRLFNLGGVLFSCLVGTIIRLSRSQGVNMEVQEIIAELKNETKRLNVAIAALEGLGSRQSTTKNHRSIAAANGVNIRPSPMGKQTSGRLTAEGRKRLSEAMKKRWAARRKSA